MAEDVGLGRVFSEYFCFAFKFPFSTNFPPRRPGFAPGSGQVGFVVDKVALGQVFSENLGFPCQSSFHQLLHHNNHPGQIQ
jgi:hypothetical protein